MLAKNAKGYICDSLLSSPFIRLIPGFPRAMQNAASLT
jgi:hypothetical protein